MELLRDELSRITGSMHCLDIKGECRRAACSTAIYSVPISAAAEADSSALFTKFIRELNKLSERMDRLEESLQREGRWPRRRRRRGNLRCYRCQQLGDIARHCRAPDPRPATKKQPSTAPSSAGSALNNTKRGSMGRSPQRDVKGLTNARSEVHPESQFLRQKQGRLAKRDLKTTAVTPSPLKMPDSQGPEVHKKAAGCARPTTRGTMDCGQLRSGRKRRPFPCDDNVGKVSAGSHATLNDWGRDLVQFQRQPCRVLSDSESLNESGLYVKPPRASAEETDKFDCEVPMIIKNRAWYIYNVVCQCPQTSSL